MEKNIGIRYLRRGEWTEATDKNGEPLRFECLGDARRYMNHERDYNQNNPVTFMERVNICRFDGDSFELIERY